MSIGSRITEARKRKRWTKKDLERAMVAEVDDTKDAPSYLTIASWEKDKTKPSVDHLTLLGRVLEVDRRWFLSTDNASDEAFEKWLETPQGRNATAEERDAVRGFPIPEGRQPTLETYNLALGAIRMTLPVDEVLIR